MRDLKVYGILENVENKGIIKDGGWKHVLDCLGCSKISNDTNHTLVTLLKKLFLLFHFTIVSTFNVSNYGGNMDILDVVGKSQSSQGGGVHIKKNAQFIRASRPPWRKILEFKAFFS